MPGTIAEFYLSAKKRLEEAGFAEEIIWQSTRSFSRANETTLLREHAWVVLNSGFREQTVRKYFDYISLCFCDWESGNEIVKNEVACFESAYPVFGNRRKLRAILEMAKLVSERGSEYYIEAIESEPIETLRSLPFVGDITAWHLAKNLGIDVAKPDRHLVRLASRFGYNCVHRMCDDVNQLVGDRVSVIDLVLWRAEERGYFKAI